METKIEATKELLNRYYEALNGVRSSVINGVEYSYVNGKQTLADYKLCLDYGSVNSLDIVKIKHGGGLVDINMADLQSLIDSLTIRGYELWLDKCNQEIEIDELDEDSETFSEDAQAILDRPW